MLWVVVSGAEIIEAEVGVVLFAAVEVIVRCCAGFGEGVAVGIVFVLIGHYASRVSQLTHAAAAIVAIEARRPVLLPVMPEFSLMRCKP